MKLKIVQAGDPVLRRTSGLLTADEIKSASVQQLIELMRDTMRDAPGVGLAAPQIGESIQLAVIEDRTEYIQGLAKDEVSERKRSAIDFHVIINPTISILGDSSAEFFEGCLSLAGFAGVVRRSLKITVECLNERAEPTIIQAEGWYARILQHEIDHLNGTLYIDRMETRSFATTENMSRFWQGQTIEQVRAALGLRKQ
ncbi:MAG TPA: peptide deformylase [Pyrinomonadaceae bacterium]|nr:peptide deformylase [Pyrinomonadaceae bacterium]